MLVAVDLDGTLCDGSHKAHLLKLPTTPDGGWEEQDWTAWREACINDRAIEATLAVVHALLRMGHTIEFWTGRGEACREVTQQWLDDHGLSFCPLRMRADDKGAIPDHVWKRQYLDWFGRPDLILEDRVSVVSMWRDEGIACWQVAEGNY